MCPMHQLSSLMSIYDVLIVLYKYLLFCSLWQPHLYLHLKQYIVTFINHCKTITTCESKEFPHLLIHTQSLIKAGSSVI